MTTKEHCILWIVIIVGTFIVEYFNNKGPHWVEKDEDE